MVELIEPVDAVSVVISHLLEVLETQPGFEDVDVAASLPGADGTPAHEAIVVRRTGGAPRDLIVDTAQITLTAWAATPGDEARADAIARRALAVTVAAERGGFMGDVPCTRVQVISDPYDDPDPVTGRARSSATYAIDLRSRVL